MRVWDTETGKLLTTMQGHGKVWPVCISHPLLQHDSDNTGYIRRGMARHWPLCMHGIR